MSINALTVFCGSKNGSNSIYEEHAANLGRILAKHNIKLVYGGGNKGLMSAVANAVLAGGGHVTGIIPKVLTEWEHQHNGLTELLVVEDMHTRKKLLYEKSDAAIILPGGYGTLDEMFEMLTWNQLSLHNKHIFILNTAGFYNHLITHIEQMMQEEFLYETIEKRMTILSTPDQLEQYL